MGNNQIAHLGLLFGSFDPIHNGHLEVIRQGLQSAGCDEVWLIVQAANAYKSVAPNAPYRDRLIMARLATEQLENVLVAELGPTIMPARAIVDTLKFLKAQSNDRQLTLLMGQDLSANLPTWDDYDEILALASVFEVNRARDDVASGQVKAAIQAGRPIDGPVPSTVAEYIFEHGLYTS